MAVFFRRIGSQKRFPPSIVGANPTAPINLMEKPVHDHEQYNDGDQAGGGLEIKRGDTIHKRADDADCDEPGDERCAEGNTRPQRHRASMGLPGACHARGNRGQDQDTFKAFAKNEDSDIEERDRWASVWTHWIGGAVFGEALPNQDGGDSPSGDRKEESEDQRVASHRIHNWKLP